MEEKTPLIITVSRQVGCGGTEIAQNIASRLKMAFLDKKMVALVSERLEVKENVIAGQDERIGFFLRILKEVLNSPTPGDIHYAEGEIIREIAKKQPTVIIGRAGNYVLRDHPKHISIFCHADKAFRQARLMQLNKISEEEAARKIEKTDKERSKYVHSVSGHDIADATQYDLCLDTGVLGLGLAEKFILSYIHERFPDLPL